MPIPNITDYCAYITSPALIHPVILKNGHPIENGPKITKYSGGFCVVFPYETPNAKYAVRCWHASVPDAQKRARLISEALKSSMLPYFANFEYYEDGIATQQGIQPIVVMDWVEAKTLKRFLSDKINDSCAINKIAENFRTMVADLHKHHFSHGDLHHDNIMIKDDYSLMLVDYDSMYVPALNGMPDEIKGIIGYQHEGRLHNKYLTEKADYFSELVIYLSLKALAKKPGLWSQLNIENTDTLLFTKEDILSKGNSPIFETLREDAELSALSEKLTEFMLLQSIDDLSPLEEVISSTTVADSEEIANKWAGGNGYTPHTTPTQIPPTENIAEKWKSGNGYVKEKQPVDKIAKEITDKFKRE